MMFSLLFTKSITDLVEWLKKKGNMIWRTKKKDTNITGLRLCFSDKEEGDNNIVFQTDENLNSPPPHMHVSLQGEQQVSEQPLVHRGPLELWDAEHGGPWAGAELPALLLRHGHSPEAQVHTQVPLQLGCAATVQGLCDTRTVSVHH